MAATTLNDTLNGTTKNETIDGLAGDDVISGGGGVDRLVGGLGDDTITATGAFTVVTQIGTDTVASTLTTGPQTLPAMAQLSGGGYVLTWVDQTEDASGFEIRAQRFDALGAKVGAELLVNAGDILGTQTQPAVTALANNAFVVTWTSPEAGGFQSNIMARGFSATDVASSIVNITANTSTSSQVEPSVAALTGGGYVVVYTNYDTSVDGSGTAINGQLVNANGTLSGGPFLVNSYTEAGQTLPTVVALTNGNFVVSWQDQIGERGTPNFTFTDVSFRIFTATGAPLNSNGQGDLSVNFQLSQNAPSIAPTAGGGFVAVWSSAHNAGVLPDSLQDAVGIFGQRFDAAGNGLGEFQVMQSLTRDVVNENNPSVTVLPDGRFVVLYESGVGGFNRIVARVFNADNTPFTNEFVVSTDATHPTLVATTGGFVISWRDIGPNPSTINTMRYTYDTVIRAATLDGGVGNDVLTDGAGDAILLGGAGADTLTGGAGNDTLTGGTEADRFVISATSAFGNDTITDYSAAQGDVLMATTPFVFADTLSQIRAGMTAIAGAAGALMLTNSHGSVRINGAGTAASVILGGQTASGDWISGGSLNNILLGGALNDTLYGDGGNDVLNGLLGNDVIDGGDGNDTLDGDDGHDNLHGRAGNDRLLGGAGNDTIHGDAGGQDTLANADTIYGGIGNDRIYAGVGNDIIYGDQNDDVIFGGTGADRIYGGDGADSMDGGPTSLFGTFVTGHQDHFFGGAGNDTMRGSGAVNEDLMYGGADHDVIYGAEWDDTLYGDNGRDTIFGGTRHASDGSV